MERWPALFYESQVKEEFKRITTINLDRTFLTKMDFYTPKLLTVFKTKGGTSGTKIKSVLESLNQQQIDSNDAVIRCLIHFLGESTEELIKDYQQDVSKDVIEQDIKDGVIKILVLGSAAEGAPLTDVIIVVDVNGQRSTDGGSGHGALDLNALVTLVFAQRNVKKRNIDVMMRQATRSSSHNKGPGISPTPPGGV
ncbi:unnamed protein product [Boreogadus saida]